MGMSSLCSSSRLTPVRREKLRPPQPNHHPSVRGVLPTKLLEQRNDLAGLQVPPSAHSQDRAVLVLLPLEVDHGAAGFVLLRGRILRDRQLNLFAVPRVVDGAHRHEKDQQEEDAVDHLRHGHFQVGLFREEVDFPGAFPSVAHGDFNPIAVPDRNCRMIWIRPSPCRCTRGRARFARARPLSFPPLSHPPRTPGRREPPCNRRLPSGR